MKERTLQASQFKAQCLAVLDDVARSRTTVVVTKHGKPVARVVPVEHRRPTDGSVTLLATDDESYFSTGERWDADG